MNNDEILIIQNYLRDIFDNEDISVRKDQDVPPTASIFISSEAIGSLQKDDDPDEEDISYSLTIPIDHSIADKENLETNIQAEREIYIPLQIVLDELKQLQNYFRRAIN